MADDARADDPPLRTVPVRVIITKIVRTLSAGHTDRAIAMAREMVRRHPQAAEFWDTLATCASGRDADLATDAAMRALVLKPDAASARYTLFVRWQSERPRAAIRHLVRALTAKPAYPEFWSALASVVRALAIRRPRQALERRAALIAPNRSRPWKTVGDWAMAEGDRTGAAVGYRRAAVTGGNTPEATLDLATADPKAVPAEMRALIERRVGASPDGGSEFDCYALAMCFDADDDRDAAFAWFCRANALHAKRLPSTGKANRLLQERTLAARLPTLRQRAQADDTGPMPIFILGQPSSGTTLLESMLVTHPDVSSAGERPEIHRIGHTLPGYPGAMADLDTGRALQLATTYRRAVAETTDTHTAFVIDKMPTNFVMIGLIRILFPQAPILHVTRHPMAVGWSQFRRRFADGHAFTLGFDRIAAYMAVENRYMAHWDRSFPGTILRVRYEAMVEDPRGAVARVLDHIGLLWDPACAAFEGSSRRVTTASALAVRSGPDRRRIDDWRRYERHLEPLRQALIAHGISV